ncbi:MAG: outer membrane beta-barrel protein [Bacteroidia bacterium]|nr:outer membrane beta-barrel protein [Bacteroidia bacterium]
MVLWTNIQGKLNARRKERRIVVLKIVGIAAAIVLAFLAGWQMTNPSGKGSIPQNSVAVQKDINSNIDRSTKENIETTEILSVKTDQVASNTTGLPQKVNRTTSSNLSSIATFAVSTSFINNVDGTTVPKSGELELFSTEKEFIDELHQNFKMVKKLTDWFANVRKDSVTTSKSNSKVVTTNPFMRTASEGSVTIALNNPIRNNAGHWSLKAEFAPVFNSQAQNNGQRSNLFYISSPNIKPQETTAENTFSGGMVAGYKVSNRLIIKSGFVYNNIRQTTRNVDFLGVNPLYDVPGNTTLASTPAGQVNLNKTGNTQMDAVMNSNFQASSSAKYSATGELKQNIEFIEIPVQATYKMIDKKIKVGLTGGISTNILVGNKATLTDNGASVSSGETANMRSVVYSGAVGLEVGYEITNRITLTVEPRVKQFINSLSTSKSVNYKPSQMGIVTGLTYSFN